ncbi:hypothetical protein B0H15DRAFT_475373 [Mycena belliarum]|uniref:Uncharacterized protein n=1 Tax=Mycena belliarum TaxID=1033014 RepID=A0AAD6XM84_9AGAR|nr:hypothetical protein B0H15DRAFT_475373 [Mycena belliae]
MIVGLAALSASWRTGGQLITSIPYALTARSSPRLFGLSPSMLPTECPVLDRASELPAFPVASISSNRSLSQFLGTFAGFVRTYIYILCYNILMMSQFISSLTMHARQRSMRHLTQVIQRKYMMIYPRLPEDSSSLAMARSSDEI